MNAPGIGRRKFLASLGATFGALSTQNFPRRTFGQDAPHTANRDQYGGCRTIAFEASGFFRLQKADRWWLVTPEGHAFLSWGINHMDAPLLQRPYNREHWRQAFGLPENPKKEDWLAHFLEKARADLDAFGFNTLGCHTNTSQYPRALGPYVHRIDFANIAHYRALTAADFPDVFWDAFATHCDGLARNEVAPRREDRYLIGYTFTDGPVFTEHEAAARDVQVFGAPRAATPTWPRVLRDLGPEAPGKQAYVRLVQRVYSGYIEEFNGVYRTVFASFDDLLNARDWRPMTDPDNFDEVRDNRLFLEEIIDRYHATVIAAIRRHDDRHLIFGDKINGNTNPPDWVVALAGRHTDLTFYQNYGYYGEQEADMDRWSSLTGKPIFNGDSSYSVPDENMPNPLGPHCATQVERAKRSFEFARQAFARPDFVGWNWCGWMDGWKSIPGKEVRQHSGLQDPFGNRYAPMVEAFSRLSRELYDIGAGS